MLKAVLGIFIAEAVYRVFFLIQRQCPCHSQAKSIQIDCQGLVMGLRETGCLGVVRVDFIIYLFLLSTGETGHVM